MPLLRRAYELWHELETDAGEQSLITTGSLEGGPDDGTTFIGVLEGRPASTTSRTRCSTRTELRLRSATRHMPGDSTTRPASSTNRRRVSPSPSRATGAPTTTGASARCRSCGSASSSAAGSRRAMAESASRHRAGTFEAERLVVCAGAWGARLAPSLERLGGTGAAVSRPATPKRPELFEVDRFPVFLIDVEGRAASTASRSMMGTASSSASTTIGFEPIIDTQLDRSVHAEDEALLRAFADRYFPDGAGPTEMLKAPACSRIPPTSTSSSIGCPMCRRSPCLPVSRATATSSAASWARSSPTWRIHNGATRHDIGLFRIDRFGS